MNQRKIDNFIRTLDRDEYKAVAVAALNELTETDAIEVIRDYVFGNDTMTEELISQLENDNE